MNIMIELPKKVTDYMMWFLIQNWTKIRKSWMMFRGTLCSTTMDGPRLRGGGVCQRDLDPSPPHNLDLCLFNTQKWITFCPIYSNLLSVCVKVQISVEKRTDRFRTDLLTDKHLNEITLISTLLLRTVSRYSKNHWKKNIPTLNLVQMKSKVDSITVI